MKMMKTMKTMKRMVVLVLSCVLCVSADYSHKGAAISGCSDFDGEDLLALDGEVLWYADFKNKKSVVTLPVFADPLHFPVFYEQAVANQRICRQNLKTFRRNISSPPLQLDAPDNMIIYARDHVELGQDNTLLCLVTGFYPAPVTVTWMKNGLKVTEGTSINVPFPNKDRTYNQMSRLKFVPQLGDIYSCTVEHPALVEPETRTWDVEGFKAVSPRSVEPAVFCGLGLAVGLLGIAAGIFLFINGKKYS